MTKEDVQKILDTTKDFSKIPVSEFKDADISGMNFWDSNLTTKQWLSAKFVRNTHIVNLDFSDITPEEIPSDKWRELGEFHWAKLLKNYPSLKTKAIHHKAGRFALFYNNPKSIETSNFLDEFKYRDWEHLLEEHLYLIERAKKYKSAWAVILSSNPELSNECPFWNDFNRFEWSYLLSQQPQFFDKCKIPHEFTVGNWNNIISHSNLTGKTENIVNQFASGWAALLQRKPRLKNKCYVWGNFNFKEWYSIFISSENCDFKDKAKEFSSGWAALLCHYPELACECDKWKLFTSEEWSLLLRSQPQFADKCDFDKFTNDDWVNLLYFQPSFAYKFKRFNELTLSQWNELLYNNACLEEEAKKYPNGWAVILRDFYDEMLIDKCDKYNEFSSEAWEYLLKTQPDLIRYKK